MNHFTMGRIAALRNRLDTMNGKLESISPYAVLSRGYSITRRADDLTVITDSGQVNLGDHLEVVVSNGNFFADVVKK